MLTPSVILLLCCGTLRGQGVLVEAIEPHEVSLHFASLYRDEGIWVGGYIAEVTFHF